MPDEIRGMVYDWNALKVCEFIYPKGIEHGPIINQTRDMPDDLRGPVSLIDEDTGEEVHRVLAYNSAAGVVDRIQCDESGKVVMRAARGAFGDSAIAIITERRRLRIVPKEPAHA